MPNTRNVCDIMYHTHNEQRFAVRVLTYVCTHVKRGCYIEVITMSTCDYHSLCRDIPTATVAHIVGADT